MKKLFIAICFILGITTTGIAQTTPAKTTTTTQTHLKKNGTPDKRYKENKTAKKGPLKKDGTPDMRYKANKTTKP